MRARRLVAIGVLHAVALAAVWFFVLRGPSPPADRAIALVPAGALAFVHLSTDPGRDADERLFERLRGFPSLRALRERFEAMFGGAFELERDVRPWLGDEAALALLDSGGPAANVLLLLAVRDEPKAQGLLTRAAGEVPAVEHRGIAVRRFDRVAVAFVDGFMAVGQEASVKAAIDRTAGEGRALRPSGELPDDRSLDAWVTRDGVRRVLRPQGGAVGAAGGLVDDPALRGVALWASATAEGIRAGARIVRAKAPADRSFEPELLGAVPAEAAFYLGLGGLEEVGPLVAGLTGLDLSAALEPLTGEVAFSIAPGLPVPEITLTTRTRDEAATREDLGRLFGDIAERLAPGRGPGQVVSLETRPVGDVEASVLQLGPDAELLSAVHEGRVVVSTAASGIERATGDGRSLLDAERFRAAIAGVPEKAEALTFLDLARLLTLGDQAGLAGSPSVTAVRDDLRRIRSVGAVAKREGTDTTAELFFEIP